MSIKTAIEWADSTANPTMGCDGCELWNKIVKACYAGQMHERYTGKTSGTAPKGYAPKFEQVTLFPGRMEETLRWKDLTGTERPDKPWLNGHPRTIFVSDMSDALSEAVPFDFLEKEIINVVRKSPHRYMWLTKRPKRMLEFSKTIGLWPDNLWPGTSITTQGTANARLPDLLEIEAKVRFVSAEPLLGPINIINAMNARSDIANARCLATGPGPGVITINGRDPSKWLHLVIVGGESGKDCRQTDLDWLRAMIAECDRYKMNLFIKQLGRDPIWSQSDIDAKFHEVFNDVKGGEMSQWPADLKVRKFPCQ